MSGQAFFIHAEPRRGEAAAAAAARHAAAAAAEHAERAGGLARAIGADLERAARIVAEIHEMAAEPPAGDRQGCMYDRGKDASTVLGRAIITARCAADRIDSAAADARLARDIGRSAAASAAHGAEAAGREGERRAGGIPLTAGRIMDIAIDGREGRSIPHSAGGGTGGGGMPDYMEEDGCSEWAPGREGHVPEDVENDYGGPGDLPRHPTGQWTCKGF